MNAIVSMAFGEQYKKLSRFTFPFISDYSKSIHADFVELTERKFNDPTYEKFQIETQLQHYNRVIWIDPDCWIRPGCPDLFSLVPETHFAAFDELPNHPGAFEHVNNGRIELGHPPCAVDRYFNTGVMVFSQCHKKLLVRPVVEIKTTFVEQTHINIRLLLNKFPVVCLPWTFNCMSIHHHEADQSHIVHFSCAPIEERIRGVKRLIAGKPIKPWWKACVGR